MTQKQATPQAAPFLFSPLKSDGFLSQSTAAPQPVLVAYSQTPEAFMGGQFSIVPGHEAKVSIFDRSFHFGDSIYEVARTYDSGKYIYGLSEHLKRMRLSSDYADFQIFPSEQVLTAMILQTARQYKTLYGKQDLYIRWMVSRGLSDFNINPRNVTMPMGYVFVKRLEVPTAADFEKGYHYAVVQRRRNHPRALEPQMKSGNYLNNVLAIEEALAMGAQDAILVGLDGFVTEGTTNNVYMVKDNIVKTAPVQYGILDGITRQKVMSVAKNLGITLQESLYTASELAAADEIFMSSSIKEVMPITILNGQLVNGGKPGPITRRLADGLRQLIAQEGGVVL